MAVFLAGGLACVMSGYIYSLHRQIQKNLQRKKRLEKAKQNPRLCVGHRGMGTYLPENTLAAFLAAAELKADIETDLWVTKCGNIVLVHGTSAHTEEEARARGQLWIPSMSLSEVKTRMKPKGDQHIPVLQEMFLVLKQYANHLILELKGPLWDIYATLLVKLIQDYDMGHRVMISSFRHHYLQAVNLVSPAMRIGLLFNYNDEDAVPDDVVARVRRYKTNQNIVEVHCKAGKLLEAPYKVQALVDSGFVVMAWFNGGYQDSVEEFQALIEIGVERICTNHLKRLQLFLQNSFTAELLASV